MNDRIRVDEVRLIDSSGEQVGVVSLRTRWSVPRPRAWISSRSPTLTPSSARSWTMGSFFSSRRNSVLLRRKDEADSGQGSQIPTWYRRGRLSGEIENLTRFLEGATKARSRCVSGREMAHQDIGRKLMERIAADLEDMATVESFPKMEGRQMIMILAPKKK